MDPASVQAKLKAKFGAPQTQVGGKGSVRRKHKTLRKSTSQDDKRLQSVLKKLNVNNIPAIEEVNLFRQDGSIIHFSNPKVQASIGANTYVVSGNAEVKKLQELLPGIINQLGQDSLENLKKIAASYEGGRFGAAAAADDDDVPALVDNVNFEEAANKSSVSQVDDVPALD
jgi:nascent polypeptide-associated complex subunit beta